MDKHVRIIFDLCIRLRQTKNWDQVRQEAEEGTRDFTVEHFEQAAAVTREIFDDDIVQGRITRV